MKIPDLTEKILKDSRTLGTFPLSGLLRAAMEGSITGLAVAREAEKVSFLAFVRGEPEGAMYADEKGELYGDTAVMLIIAQETFVLHEVRQEIIEALVMGCRIYDKSHLRQGITKNLPEIGIKSQGIGHLTILIRRNREPQKGVRVSIRKDGKIVGSDFTSGDGSAGFRVMHGDYDCIVQDKEQQITVFTLHFTESMSTIPLEL